MIMNRIGNLAVEMDMTIASTKLPHQTDYKITWLIPGRNTGNQIDYKKTQKIIQAVLEVLLRN